MGECLRPCPPQTYGACARHAAEDERNERIARTFDRIWRELGHEGRRAHIRWLMSRRTRHG